MSVLSTTAALLSAGDFQTRPNHLSAEGAPLTLLLAVYEVFVRFFIAYSLLWIEKVGVSHDAEVSIRATEQDHYWYPPKAQMVGGVPAMVE